MRAPPLKVSSIIFPDCSSFSFVLTKAPPLPGFTCWNSTTFQRFPLCFPRGNVDVQNFSAAGGYLCVSPRKTFGFPKISIRQFPICVSLRKLYILLKDCASGGSPFVFQWGKCLIFLKKTASGGFPFSSQGKCLVSRISRLRRFPLCVSLREMFLFWEIRLRRVSLCVPLREMSSILKKRLRRIFLCVPLRQIV